MEENELVEGFEVPSKLIAEIKAKAEKLKENVGVKRIIPLVIEGDEFDSKDFYVGYFRQPSTKTFSKYVTAAQSDNIVAMKVLAKDCFVDGDKELLDDESLFLFGLMGRLQELIKMRNGKLVNLSKPGK